MHCSVAPGDINILRFFWFATNWSNNPACSKLAQSHIIRSRSVRLAASLDWVSAFRFQEEARCHPQTTDSLHNILSYLLEAFITSDVICQTQAVKKQVSFGQCEASTCMSYSRYRTRRHGFFCRNGGDFCLKQNCGYHERK